MPADHPTTHNKEPNYMSTLRNQLSDCYRLQELVDFESHLFAALSTSERLHVRVHAAIKCDSKPLLVIVERKSHTDGSLMNFRLLSIFQSYVDITQRFLGHPGPFE